MEETKRRSITLETPLTVRSSAGAIFPLLCPVVERDWVDGWDADVLHSQTGVAELGCVFSTDFGERGHEIWVVTRYEPNQRIDFARFSADASRVTTLSIGLEERRGGERPVTDMVWIYTHYAVDDAGDEWVDNVDPEAHRALMDHVAREIEYYLDTGTMLSRTA